MSGIEQTAVCLFGILVFGLTSNDWAKAFSERWRGGKKEEDRADG